jgi:hypothetical protein
MLMAQVMVSNRSDRPVRVQYDGDMLVLDEGGFRVPAPVMLVEAGIEVQVFVAGSFSIAEYAENFAARTAGERLPYRVAGTVAVHDDLDAGVTDTWTLDLSGCPVVPDPLRDGVWMLAPEPIRGGGRREALEYELLPPRQRTYWASRSAVRELT